MAGVSKQVSATVLTRATDFILIVQLLSTLALVTSACFAPIRSPDFWWQLSEGQEILATGDINGPLPRAFGLAAFPFINEYVVYDSLIAVVHHAVGIEGLRVFFGVLNFLPFALILAICLRCRSRIKFTYLLVGTAAFGLLYVRLVQRPEVVGRVLLVFLGLTLLRDPGAKLSLVHYAIVAALLFFWSNLHSSFIVGLGMLSLWILETLWRHRLDQDFRVRLFSSFALLVVALTGAVLNLNGFNRLSAPIYLQTNFWSRAVTVEMWPIEFQWYWIIGSIVGLGIYFWWATPFRSRPLWLLALLLLTTLMALVSIRHMNLLGCSLLLLLAFRLKADAQVFHSAVQRPLALTCQLVVSLAITVIMGYFLLQHLSSGAEQRKHEEWAANTQMYAVDAFLELHRREPNGAALLADTLDGAYAQRARSYKLRPLIDTGLSRYSDETAKFFFYLDTSQRHCASH